MAEIDELGREVLDQTPVAIPIPFTRPEPIHLRLRRMVEQYHREMKESEEYETFEDADDFDVDDGAPSYEDTPSEYEQNFMPKEEFWKRVEASSQSAGGERVSTAPQEPAQPANPPAQPTETHVR